MRRGPLWRADAGRGPDNRRAGCIHGNASCAHPDTLRVRVHDVRKKKRLFHLEDSNGGITPPGIDPETEPRTTLEDVDQDGSPEIVSTVPKTGQRTQVRKWRQGKFVETRTP